MTLRRGAALAIVAALWAHPGAARGDGAFPDELQVFAPNDFPHRIVLGTNFGLVISDDDGAHFDLVCEAHVSGTIETVIGYAAGPGGALYAMYGDEVARSDDEGCTWTVASGSVVAAREVTDVFADPTDAGRVAALELGPTGGPLSELFVSLDRGTTFGPALYSEPAGNLLGVEYATSEPGTLYLTGARIPSDGGGRVPFLRALVDGGWSEAIHLELDGDLPYLAAVDPGNAARLYLRIVPPSASDLLAISPDRGVTVTTALALGEAMSAFALGGDGTLYVGTESGSIWVRAPSSTAFVKQPSPRLRCLAERTGTLYGCADSLADGYALGVSTDQGATFSPILRYGQLRGLLACPAVQSSCEAALASFRTIFPAQLPDGGPEDAGPSDAGPSADAGPAGGAHHVGCGCSGADDAAGLALAALLGLGARKRSSQFA